MEARMTRPCVIHRSHLSDLLLQLLSVRAGARKVCICGAIFGQALRCVVKLGQWRAFSGEKVGRVR